MYRRRYLPRGAKGRGGPQPVLHRAANPRRSLTRARLLLSILVGGLLIAFEASESVADFKSEREACRVFYFGDGDWKFLCAEAMGKETLSTDKSSAIQVKAYGWRPLGDFRQKAKDDPWWSRGEKWQKWGWRLIFHHVSDQPRKLRSVQATLLSDGGFELDLLHDGRHAHVRGLDVRRSRRYAVLDPTDPIRHALRRLLAH